MDQKEFKKHGPGCFLIASSPPFFSSKTPAHLRSAGNRVARLSRAGTVQRIGTSPVSLSDNRVNERLSFVFSADRTYTPHLATAVTSLLETNLALVKDVFVITPDEHSSEMSKFAGFVASTYGLNVRFVSIDSGLLTDLFVSGHISEMTYARFLMGSLLPRSLDHVVYLDSDLVVTGQLDGLAQMEKKQAPSTVVMAVPSDSGEHLAPYGFSGDKYFNAGVLFVDLIKWRDAGIEQKLFSVGKRLFSKLHLWDQDVLNIVLQGRWAEMPAAYNQTRRSASYSESRIVHFVGASKPWTVGGDSAHKALYDRFRSLTPFWPYIPSGLGRMLFKLLVPRPLQRPRRLFRRFLRRLRRLRQTLIRMARRS